VKIALELRRYNIYIKRGIIVFNNRGTERKKERERHRET
jgi:hypothetical protein